MTTNQPRQAAPFAKRVMSATRAETLSFVRRGESVLVTLLLPVVALVFISWKGESLVGAAAAPERLVPSILAIALIASAFVSPAISTGYDRKYGVLRRLGVTPLGKRGLLWAKILSVLGLVALQMVLLLVTAMVAMGWRFSGNALAFALFIIMGTAAFCSLGLLLAGTLSAEMTLALSNALFVVATLFGGVLVTGAALGDGLLGVTSLLPSAALTSGLRAACEGKLATGALLTLLSWTIGGSLVTARAFRWD